MNQCFELSVREETGISNSHTTKYICTKTLIHSSMEYTCSFYQTKQYLNHLQKLKHFFILLREIRLNQRRPLRLYKK